MYETIEIRHFRYCVTVAEAGNFTRAAEQLHVSQPALSTQIKQLEEESAARLFVRGSSGAKLTPAGVAFLPLAKQLLRLKDRALETAHMVHLGKSLPFQVGFSPFVNRALAETVLAVAKELFPAREIREISESTSHLLQLLVESSLDAALLTLPLTCKALIVQKIDREPILVCVRKDDPIAGAPSIPKEALNGKLTIFSKPENHAALYDYLIKQLTRAGIVPNPCVFVSAPADVQWMVKRKEGYALVRKSVALDEELTLLPITDVELFVESGFVYSAANEQPSLGLLAYRLKEYFRNLAAKKKPARVPLQPPEQLPLLG